MKMYLKVIGGSCYTCLPRGSPATAQTAREVAPGTPPVARCLRSNETPKQGPARTHTCIQKHTPRNSTLKQ